MPLAHALLYILASTLFISGTATAIVFYLDHLHQSRLENPTYIIRNIVQTGPQKEQLKSSYLCELLDLSSDKPTHLYQLDLQEAAQKLRMSPLIKQVHLKRLKPTTLYIDYTIREPIAYLAEFPNIAIDQEGRAFPLHPFYTPKNLPKLILGITSWQKPLPARRLQLALRLLSLQPRIVDTSRIDHPSPGRREVILTLDETTLRLDPQTIDEALDNYAHLKDHLAKAPKFIDLRMPHVAHLSDLDR